MNTAARWVPLRHYLRLQQGRRQQITLSFRQIEDILGDGLPKPARKYPEWWANDAAHDQAHAWLDAGWQIQTASLETEQITLIQAPRP